MSCPVLAASEILSVESFLKKVEASPITKSAHEKLEALYNSALLKVREVTPKAKEILQELPKVDRESLEELKQKIFNTPLQKDEQKQCSSKMCKTSIAPPVSEGSPLLIFVSFSLGDATLKKLYGQAQKIGSRLVMQGLYKNSFRETQSKIRSLGIVVDIDPTLFEKFSVKEVPVFVLMTEETPLVTNGESHPSYDVLKGNVSLNYALEEFLENGSIEGQKIAQNLIDRIRRAHDEGK
ncbi:MAG: type-F conjugative transfer system pilin assembly protein TrbC [Alphaproteobacteria bacterium]